MSGTGQVQVDFGAFPGASDASIAVTGIAGIASGSLVEAWIFPATTTDHSADEHVVETIKVVAGNVVAGTGFTIYAINTSMLNEPVPTDNTFGGRAVSATGQAFGPGKQDGAGPINTGGGMGTRLYGKWNCGYVWV
jgi:hypothetical protein